MGYCTDQYGRLCCDRCDRAGGVVRRRCPSGWCGPHPLCDDCYKAVRASGEWDRAHKGCPAASARYRAEQAAEADALAAGKAVRCSALQVAPGIVQVIFRRANGTTEGRYVPARCYDKAKFGEVWTPEDFDRIAGYALPLAPATFADGRATKGGAL